MKSLIKEINEFYESYLGYKPEETSLRIVGEKNWEEFLSQFNLKPKTSGVYFQREQNAFIPEGNTLSLFHEYFGHGLYGEKNLKGIRYVELEKKLFEEEKKFFNGKKFSLEELNEFRKSNKFALEIEERHKRHYGEVELFALWSEYFLSKEFGFEREYEREYEKLNTGKRNAVDSTIAFSKEYGNLATFYEQGMARNTTPGRAAKLLGEMFGKDLNESRLVILTGSKKPFSDIDLFASSNYLKNIQSNWIDLVSFGERDFEEKIKLFDVQLTNALFQGDFVYGDLYYFDRKKDQLLFQPITQEAINYNLSKAENNRVASEITNSKELKELYSSYFQTYLKNALLLKGGKRKFSKDDILKTPFIEEKNSVERRYKK